MQTKKNEITKNNKAVESIIDLLATKKQIKSRFQSEEK